MPTSLEALFVLVLVFPGCLGYFSFTQLYNGRIEDSVDKLVCIGVLNVLPLLLFGWLTKTDIWAEGRAPADLEHLGAFVRGTLFYLSALSVVIGGVTGALANWRPVHYLMIRGRLTRRTQDSSVLASVIASNSDAYMKFRFKSGGYVIGHPRLYSLSGDETAIFLANAARRPAKAAAGQPQPAEYPVEGPGILLLDFDDVLCVEVMSGV
jgi:hypothetical protein